MKLTELHRAGVISTKELVSGMQSIRSGTHGRAVRVASGWEQTFDRQVYNRGMGMARSAGGALEIIFSGKGGRTAPVLIAHGSDEFWAGLRQYLTGEEQDNYLVSAQCALGADPATARWLDLSLGLVDLPGGLLDAIRNGKLLSGIFGDASKMSTRSAPSSSVPAAVAPRSNLAPVIGYVAGEGATALTPNRLQHGTRHLTEAGLLPSWSGKNSPQIIADRLVPILERPVATFSNSLGGRRVIGFIGSIDGRTVAVQVFAEGPRAGQLATAVVPLPSQLVKWGVSE